MKGNAFHDNNNNNSKSCVKENGFGVSKATTEHTHKEEEDYFLFLLHITYYFTSIVDLSYNNTKNTNPKIDFMDNIQQRNKTKRMDLKFL